MEGRITAKNGVQASNIQLIGALAVVHLIIKTASQKLQVMLHPLSEAKTQ